MHIPDDQRFYLHSTKELTGEIKRLDLTIPLDPSTDGLKESFPWEGGVMANRFCAQPMACCDAEANGAPSELTFRRYERLACGGYGIIWLESTAVHPAARREHRQLCLSAETESSFLALVSRLKEVAAEAGQPAPLLILQLDHKPDERIQGDPESARTRFLQAAEAAAGAGFDGVDLCCSGRNLLQENVETFLGAEDVESAMSSAILWDLPAQVRDRCPDLVLGVRLCAYAARTEPLGLGADPGDYRCPDLRIPALLARRLAAQGVRLLNITADNPARRLAPESAAKHPLPAEAYPHEHPLAALQRRMEICKQLREAVHGMVVIGDGFSWLRHVMPAAAAGFVREGYLDMIGLGRFALAYPQAPTDVQVRNELDPGRCCIQCGACTWLRDADSPAGCVLQDAEVYGPIYRESQRSTMEHVTAEAARCHLCDPAPCSRATPGGLDIASMMRAWAANDPQRAGRLLRRDQVLPEMCARLAPAYSAGETDCIETTLCGRPIPIRDLQLQAALYTRETSGKLRLPAPAGGRCAIVGGGPAGIAAAAVLLEAGRQVVLYEKADRLGGVPGRLIPSERYRGADIEIENLLGEARRAGRLEIHLSTALGETVSLEDLRQSSDAVLLAPGLWSEHSLGSARGVFSGLDVLEQSARGTLSECPERVALLSGGDCAMDAACVLKRHGAEQLFILFGASRAEMHWCMEESWFAQPGVHALMLCRPLGYRTDETGHVSGVEVARMDPGQVNQLPPILDDRFVLSVNMVVEAMGLTSDPSLRRELRDLTFNEAGLLHRPDPVSFCTNQTGVYAAGALINGGASVPQCVDEGMRAGREINRHLATAKG